MIPEQEAIRRLRNGEVCFSPFSLKLIEQQPRDRFQQRLNAVLRTEWRNRCYDFSIEYKSYSTPRLFQDAVNRAMNAPRPKGVYSMVMAPYLSEDQLRQLEEKGLSGLDLCGNGIIQVPGELLVFRTGAPNLFPSSAPIKNIYRGKSSLVARAFLARPIYSTVNEIVSEIERRGDDGTSVPWDISIPQKDEKSSSAAEPDTMDIGEILEKEKKEYELQTKVAVSTVSKALKALEEDLIVGRGSGIIRLLQPEKLLNRLVENYRPPEIRTRLSARYTMNKIDTMEKLAKNVSAGWLSWTMTGYSSTLCYGVMAQEPVLSLYCPELSVLTKDAGLVETQRFPDIEVLETRDETAYFDLRSLDGRCTDIPELYRYPAASPVQTYLELMAGDKRDQETAEQVKRVILAEIERQAA